MKTKSLIVFLILTPALLFQHCNISEPTAPRWDVSMNIPIAKKDYTLLDLIEKNSDILKSYQSGVDKGLLYYSNSQEIETITLNDKLKVSGFSENVEQNIGSIKIANDSVRTEVGLDWTGVNVPPGTQAKIPPIENASINSEFSSTSQFNSLEIDHGKIGLSIENHFSSLVTLSISNILLQNSATGEDIINHATPIDVGPGQKVSISNIQIAKGTTINNPFKFSCNISTTGSNGQDVLIPQSSFSVSSKLEDIEVVKATAKIPPQNPIIIDNALEIDKFETQPTKILSAKLKNGNLNLTINNRLDVDAEMSFEFPNIKTSSGQIFSTTKLIPRKQTVVIFNNYSLAGHSIVSQNSTPTSQLNYKVSFEVKESNDFRTISSTDGISADVGVENLELDEFNGILKPTEMNSTRTSVSLNTEDLKEKLKFKQINIRNPKLELHLVPTSQIEFSINGRIEARNSLGQKSILNLNSNTLRNKFNVGSNLISATDTVLYLFPDSLSKFFRNFSSFPDSIIVIANGIANPNYKPISVKSTDVISGNSNFEFPLNLALQDGIFKDSVSIDFSDKDLDELDKVNQLSAVLKISNGVPAKIEFTGKLYDEFDNFLMYFPPKYDDQDTILTVSEAMTNSSGDVISNSEQVISVQAKKAAGEIESDIQKLKRAKYMLIRLKLNTSSNGSLPVKFKTDNMIQIHAAGSTNYSVQP